MLLIVEAYHKPPRAVGIALRLRSAAMALRLRPSFRSVVTSFTRYGFCITLSEFAFAASVPLLCTTLIFGLPSRAPRALARRKPDTTLGENSRQRRRAASSSRWLSRSGPEPSSDTTSTPDAVRHLRRSGRRRSGRMRGISKAALYRRAARTARSRLLTTVRSDACTSSTTLL